MTVLVSSKYGEWVPVTSLQVYVDLSMSFYVWYIHNVVVVVFNRRSLAATSQK